MRPLVPPLARQGVSHGLQPAERVLAARELGGQALLVLACCAVQTIEGVLGAVVGGPYDAEFELDVFDGERVGRVVSYGPLALGPARQAGVQPT